MSDELWDEVYRLKRMVGDLRAALREMNARVSALEDRQAPPEDEEMAQVEAPLEQGGARR